MTHQEASTSGSPLIYVGDDDINAEKETSIDKWPGMKPSQCWIDNGISQIQGKTIMTSRVHDDRGHPFLTS